MEFYKNIPGVEVVNAPSLPPPARRQPRHMSNQFLTNREGAQTRLAMRGKTCAECRSLRWPHLGTIVPTDLKLLEKRAKNGTCYTCGLLLQWVDRLVKGKGKVERLELQFKETLELHIDFTTGSLESKYVTWQLHTNLSSSPPLTVIFRNAHSRAGSPALWTTIQPLPTVPGDTGSDISLLWVLRKIYECSWSHTFCINERMSKLNTLPTRVLDLGNPEWPKDPSLVSQYLTSDIRLCEPTESSRERYFCLSHCWGHTSSMLKTTRSNHKERCQSICWSILPTTFQDSVIFTRKLRIRYLWIDSLCIIQDDKEDWAREAAKMCSVYEGAFLTLCATTASDCNNGLFVNSASNELSDPRSKRIETTPWEVSARRKLDHSIIASNKWVAGKSLLLKRGWVYQERLLSKRVLHFGPRELI